MDKKGRALMPAIDNKNQGVIHNGHKEWTHDCPELTKECVHVLKASLRQRELVHKGSTVVDLSDIFSQIWRLSLEWNPYLFNWSGGNA